MNEFGRIAIIVIACIGIGALIMVAARATGFPIPGWFITGAWIVLAVVVLILAVKLIMRAANS